MQQNKQQPVRSFNPFTHAESFRPLTAHDDVDNAGTNLTTLSGESHKRFVMVTTLLSLIDPVRGEPTTHSLDRHAHDDLWKPEQLQKKFLDSFALIASTSRVGGETASAVCLEQGHPGGTVLRLASNQGVKGDTLEMLQEVLNALNSVASRGIMLKRSAGSVQHELMAKITVLTKDKILSILERLNRPATHEDIQNATVKLKSGNSISQYSEEFCTWVHGLPSVASSPPEVTSDVLISNIEWASQAKWVYPDEIEALLSSDEGELPLWLKHIYKLGRYYAAAKAMLKIAVKQPRIFDNIHVEAVPNPPQEDFSLENGSRPLLTVLIQKAFGTEVWLTHDPEARLRRACRMTLTVHAEMQLLSFYDHNPERTPRLLFMGTSKKACYLCYEFMSRQPLAIGVSASHQKLYRGWTLAPLFFQRQEKAQSSPMGIQPISGTNDGARSRDSIGHTTTDPPVEDIPRPTSPSSSNGAWDMRSLTEYL
ncbi:uncharacterized protein B0I36DRAFT_394316 [Microdochium trichocladiopsis]|uniref:Uncharacterized protein n=1 Tax=Microdochium trichocladiopsis TaxID=1682393 RepID=A0A9P8XWR0_9PEZI|nr:uncharacterized protein B0I36DRAFT_394316 [Microdochium trichocladiopsis]KAH7021590.1 hypothetical protein B0I36DRAFT_394316 [Microdochium trichocladiopsis]